MDIYEVFNNARENLNIRINRTDREIRDGEYFDMVVEISNPKRSIFPFVKEPSFAYEDLVLKVKETMYTRPMDPVFVEGYHVGRPLNPSDKVTVTVPLEAKMDLPTHCRAEDIFKVVVEAQVDTHDLFRFGKTSEGGSEFFPPP